MQQTTDTQRDDAEFELAKIKAIRNDITLLVQNKAHEIIMGAAALVPAQLGDSQRIIDALTDWQRDGLHYVTDALGDTFGAREFELRDIINAYKGE